MERFRISSAIAAGALLGLGGCALEAQTDRDAKFTVATCHSYAFSDQQADGPTDGRSL